MKKAKMGTDKAFVKEVIQVNFINDNDDVDGDHDDMIWQYNMIF